MKKIASLSIVLLLICFSVNISIANASSSMEMSLECDPELSYDGNWDLHVGGCWTPPDPQTCEYCWHTT